MTHGRLQWSKKPACPISWRGQVHLAQSAQLVRDGRFGHVQPFCQWADAHLAFDQKRENPHAAGIAEGAEEFSELDGFEFTEFHDI